ncbi:MAG TPA: PAS domain S-box protein [Gaiellaceae bacterium]
MAPPRLFLRFALWSAVALAVAVGAGLFLASWNANARARDRAVREAKAVSVMLGHDDLAKSAFAWPRPGGGTGSDLLSFLDDFFSPSVAGGSPAKVVLYSPAGVVTYATDRSLIGKTADDPGRVRAALHGPEFRVAGGIERSYVPVTWLFDPAHVRGVLELQHDYAPVAAEIHDDWLFQSGTIALALLALYLAMLPIMRRVTGSLRRSYIEASRLAAIVDSSSDAIVGRDQDGLISSWNAGAERIYGWTADEMIGKPVDVLLPADREAGPDSIDLTRTVHVGKDGRRIDVSVTVSPVRDAKKQLVGSAMIARDVTELSRLEEELREAHRQEAVGRLAGGLARDFGALLDAVDAAADTLRRVSIDDLSLQELAKIRRATEQGAALAEQLLAVGGVQEAHPEPLDLNEAIARAEPQLRRLAGDHVDLVTELEPGLGLVDADPAQIEQLILNLAANARDEMPRGGRITLRTAAVDFGRRAARRGTEQPGAAQYVMFSVSDTGSGLPGEVRARPFEPFVRRSESGERMALGLAAVCGIVKQSGGTMGVEAAPAGGTTIRVYLPVAAQATALTA